MKNLITWRFSFSLVWFSVIVICFSLVINALSVPPQRKSLIATSLIVAVSLFVVAVNYSEKPYFLLQPMFGQTFSSHWMFSKQPYKAFKPHLGYVSIPKQEVRGTNTHTFVFAWQPATVLFSSDISFNVKPAVRFMASTSSGAFSS